MPRDEWLSDTLPLTEQLRLVDCQRPFQIHSQGRFVLRPDADATELIAAALGERENTTENLLLLHRHLATSFSHRGCSLTDGPLYKEVQRLLIADGLIPEPPAPRNILAELRAEGRI